MSIQDRPTLKPIADGTVMAWATLECTPGVSENPYQSLSFQWYMDAEEVPGWNEPRIRVPEDKASSLYFCEVNYGGRGGGFGVFSNVLTPTGRPKDLDAGDMVRMLKAYKGMQHIIILRKYGEARAALDQAIDVLRRMHRASS